MLRTFLCPPYINDSLKLSFLVKCKLQIHGGHKIKLVEGSSAAIDISYTNTGIQSLSCVIKSENDIALSGTINTLHKNGTVDITPADTGQLVFGSYMVVFAVFNGTVEVDSTTALLLYERELAGLTVCKMTFVLY